LDTDITSDCKLFRCKFHVVQFYRNITWLSFFRVDI